MVYYPRRRRALRSKKTGAKRMVKPGVYARRRLQYRQGKKGKIVITRKLPELTVNNTGAGTAVVSTSGGALSPTCLVIGTPVQSTGASGTSSYDIPFSMKFTLSQLINHTDITNLCDKYRIAGAYIRMYYNKSGASVNSTGSYPHLQYITDHDDAILPTVAGLREKMGVKFKTFANSSSYIGIKCRPVPNREVFNTGITSGYEVPKYAPYLDCANDTVEHYGVKGIISNFNLPATANIEIMKVDVVLKIVAKDFQ